MNDEWEYSNPDYGTGFYANQDGQAGTDEWMQSNPDYSSLPSGGGGGEVGAAGAAGGNSSYLSQLASLLGGGNSSGLVGALSAGTGLYDLLSHSPNSAQGINAAAAQAADPFMSQRAQYQPMLQNLMTNTTQALQNDPAFQARLQTGLEGTARQQAAQGYLGSGNILEALQAKGQTMASEEIGNQFNRLALLSGAQTGSPASAGQIIAGRYGQRNNAMANIGGALGMGGGQGGTTGAGGGAGGAGAGGAAGGGSSLGGIASSLSSLYGLGSKLGGLLGMGGSGTVGVAGGGAGAGGAAGATAAGAEAAGAGTGAAAGAEAGAAGGGGAGAGGAALGATGTALLAAYLGYNANERFTARGVEGANRTLDRLQQAGINPDYSKLFTVTNPWKDISNSQALSILGSGQELNGMFSPTLELNKDYANQLLASNPQAAALGVDLHDLGGDFKTYIANTQMRGQQDAAQKEYDNWLRQYMYAPRPGHLADTQGGG